MYSNLELKKPIWRCSSAVIINFEQVCPNWLVSKSHADITSVYKIFDKNGETLYLHQTVNVTVSKISEMKQIEMNSTAIRQTRLLVLLYQQFIIVSFAVL